VSTHGLFDIPQYVTVLRSDKSPQLFHNVGKLQGTGQRGGWA